MNNILKVSELYERYKQQGKVFMIPNLVLLNTSLILGAREKTGKSSLALDIIQAIEKNDDFLDIKAGEYNVDAIVYYSNDSTEQSIAIKLDKMNFNLNPRLPIYFIFGRSMRIDEFGAELSKLELMESNTLIIVDVLGGLKPTTELNLNDYTSVSTMLDEFETNIEKLTKGYGIIYLHHLNKANRGELMGSQALGARVGAKIIMELDEDQEHGVLKISANDYNSRQIFVKKDNKHHKWIIDKNSYTITDKDFEHQMLLINEALHKAKENRLKGNVNQIVSWTRIDVPPKKLTRWLKKHRKQLKDNNIQFCKTKSNTTIIELYVTE